jgi:hypothetical protein
LAFACEPYRDPRSIRRSSSRIYWVSCGTRCI